MEKVGKKILATLLGGVTLAGTIDIALNETHYSRRALNCYNLRLGPLSLEVNTNPINARISAGITADYDLDGLYEHTRISITPNKIQLDK